MGNGVNERFDFSESLPNLADVPRGATIIVNTDEFSTRNLKKVGWATSPLDDDTLESWHVHALPLTSITVEALAEFDSLTRKEKERAKNMFALGLLSWMYSRPITATEDFLTSKFGAKPDILAANLAALRAGWNYGETTEDFAVRYEIAPAAMAEGTYRNITGNQALALGLVAAAHRKPQLTQEQAQLVEPLRRWTLVDTIQRRQVVLVEETRRRHVGGQHALLDQLVGIVTATRHDLLDLAQHAQTQRQPGVDAGGLLLDHAGAQHQLVRDDLRVRRRFLQRGQEIARQAHGRGILERRDEHRL